MKKKVIVSVLISVCLIVFIVGFICLTPYINYRYATHLYNEKNYIDASEIFLDLGTYKDSKNMYNNSQFNLAKDYVQQEKYDEALLVCKTSSQKEEISELINKKRLDNVFQFINAEEYSEAANLLSQIDQITFRTADEVMEIFDVAKKLYTDGDFNNSKIFLLALKDFGDTSEIEKNIEVLQKIQGDWYGSDDGYYTWFRINGWEIQSFNEMFNEFTDPNKLIHDEETQSFYNKIGNYTKSIIYVENDIVYEKWIDNDGKTHIFKCERKDIVPKKNPQLGMTAEEVRKSTWGNPEDINKHTYSWGIKEQWCYSGNRYIYLEDGIVTSISE